MPRPVDLHQARAEKRAAGKIGVDGLALGVLTGPVGVGGVLFVPALGPST